MNRALRKRAGKLLEKGQKQLSKLRGADLQTTSLRLSTEQYVATLSPFVDGPSGTAGDFVKRLAQNLMTETERDQQLTETRFIEPGDLQKIDCGMGCSWCCRRAVRVSIPDAVSVAAYLLENEIEVDLESYLRELEECGRDGEALQKSFAPCPFLSEGGLLCRVYEARPVVCRAFHSLDVDQCRSKVEERATDRDIPMYVKLFGMRGMRLSGAREALKELGLDDRPVILARAVKLLLDDFEGVCGAWLDGEPVFDPATYD